MGSSVNVNNIKTNGTTGDGVMVTGYGGQNASLNATSSHFDEVQVGDGLEIRGGGSATIDGSTFKNNGTSPDATNSSVGLDLNSTGTATVTNSQFIGNKFPGLVAQNQSQVTVEQSTFSGSQKGDGALIMDNATANLYGNTFSSNGQVVGESTGFNGLEFIAGYSGNAIVSGNTFVDNTGNGIFVGGSANNLQIVGNVFRNTFQGNVGGINLDSSVSTIHATLVGNQFSGPANPPNDEVGILALGNALYATIGGSGSDANSFDSYSNGNFINEADGSGPNQGCPHLTILDNSFTRNGQTVAPSHAIMSC